MGARALMVEEGEIEGSRCEGEAGEEVGGETHTSDRPCNLNWDSIRYVWLKSGLLLKYRQDLGQQNMHKIGLGLH